MLPFLKIVADDLYKKLNGDFQNTTIIFPNKRATLFFTQYLAENAGGKTMWSPEYTTISELFSSLSDSMIGDPVYLTTMLFGVYDRVMQPTKSFDELFPLMEMMLADFQDIDNNMVVPRDLFQNINDLKELTDFSYLEPEQKKALEDFFNHYFDNVKSDTAIKTQFSSLWNRLTQIYEEYHSMLMNADNGGDALVYEGMLKRQVIETLNGTDEEQRQRMDARLTSQTYVMVGFNVLNKTEMALFRYLKENRDTKFYWDYDKSYASKSGNSSIVTKYEAGQFILENIDKLGDELKGEDIFRNMSHPKTINFIQSPTENAQTRYIDQWVKDNIRPDDQLNESAIILCNEQTLQPVLHSIPSHLGKKKDEKAPLVLNVTMGYPLSDTPVFSFIQSLLELQLHGNTQFGSWRFKYVSAILKHSFVRRMVGEEAYTVLHTLTRNNVIFPEESIFSENAFLKTIFTKHEGRGLTEYISNILIQIGNSYSSPTNATDFTLQLYKESIFTAYQVVNRIHTMQETCSLFTANDGTLARLIMRFLRSSSIPLHGEPANGLQVMGFLETRNLDFRNIIMLSTNEGQMPSSTKRPSLIPYTLRKAFGMTTIEKEVSIYAYYYYRLLQRAESITLLYNSSTESGGKGEMSRFMLQTLAESDKLFSPEQKITQYAFNSESEILDPPTVSVVKDETIMQKLHDRFNEEKVLSPSAINVYLKCPLQFYFHYVAGLKMDDEVSEDVDNSMFGTIFHYAMEKIYEPHIGRLLTSDDILKLKYNEPLILQKIDNGFAVKLFNKPEKQGNAYINYSQEGKNRIAYNGTQLVNRHVLAKYIMAQLQADSQIAQDAGNQFRVENTEKEVFTLINAETSDGKIFPIKIGGIVDRIDRISSPEGDKIRIVDYKTSSKPHKCKEIDDLFEQDHINESYHITQALYYSYVLTQIKEYSDMPVMPALMYFINNKNPKEYSGVVKVIHSDNEKETEITDFAQQCKQLYEHFLTKTINELFSPGEFVPCTNEKPCAFCDFATFCGRKEI